MTRTTRKVTVLASGNGSNLQAVIDATCRGELPIELTAVVSDQPDAHALTRAVTAGIPAVALPRLTGESRHDYDGRLAAAVVETGAELIVLAGFMRLLSMEFLRHFPDAVVNLHPALPGELPGVNAIERAYDEFRRGERTATGAMVHYVPDEGVDDGPLIATIEVPCRPGDTLDDLTARVHAAEHRLLVAALAQLTATTATIATPAIASSTPGREDRP